MCVGDRVLVTRDDGVREIVCEACYGAPGIIENFDARLYLACATEAYPHAWTYGLPPSGSLEKRSA